MWALLAVVATAAAVLSFSALSDLALLCGFHERLTWMMPVVVDAGAAAGALIWLGTSSPIRALRFARSLTWVLLASSVMGNAVVHYLAAYGLRPAWWLVVIVSAVAPSVLGSVIHLAVLVGRDVSMSPAIGLDVVEEPETPTVPPIPASVGVSAPAPKRVRMTETSDSLVSRTRELLPIGHVKLSRALGVGEYQAKQLLKQAKAEAPRNGVKVLEDA